MNKYYITYEVRAINAIGIWWHKSDTIEASSETEAFQLFRDKYNKIYEFRLPVKIVKND